MQTPREIYTAYKIMPNLQLHQLRVAAVGKVVSDTFTRPINQNDVVLAGLFHDMGNILKFDFSHFPGFTEPEGIHHWESIKTEYRKKYGPDEHVAHVTIAREIGLPERVISLIDGVGFSKMERIRDSDSFEQKIVEYGDARVGPHGILALKDRLEEGRTRYNKNPNQDVPRSPEEFEKIVLAAAEIESQIFAQTRIRPEDVDDAAIAPIIEELWEYPVIVS